MNLNELHSAYFVGIGGIGMSALARYFHQRGVNVFGYDKTRNNICVELESMNIAVHYNDNPDEIPTAFTEAPKAETVVIYTPAVPPNHRELTALKAQGYETLKRSVALGQVVSEFKTIAIAGTHGKTTTSALVAHILMESGLGCNAFLGGISTNYNSNLLVDSNSEYAVVEADEYDRSFMTLHPNWAIITSIETDHMDIYGDDEHLVSAFRAFVQQIKSEGLLIARKGLPDLQPKVLIQEYAIEEEAEIRAEQVTVKDGVYQFDFVSARSSFSALKMGLPGRHNVENAIAAVGIAMALKVDETVIRRALESFRGVKRRFEVHIRTSELVYIDDYAHHPTEIKVFVSSVKEMFPDKKITGVFQPHLYSRTRDLANDFAAALSLLDEIVLMEVYAAREERVEGVDAEMLLGLVEASNKKVLSGNELLEHVRHQRPEVLLTMGAGDIDQWVEPIKTALS